MAAGEAHWQAGIVERHIAGLKKMLKRRADVEKKGFGLSPYTAIRS